MMKNQILSLIFTTLVVTQVCASVQAQESTPAYVEPKSPAGNATPAEPMSPEAPHIIVVEPPIEAPPAPAIVVEPAVQEEKEERVPAFRRRHRFLLGAFATTGATAQFDDATYTVGSVRESAEIEFTTENVFGLTAEIRSQAPHAWGYQVGIAIESQRGIKESKLKTKNDTIRTTYNDKPKFRSTLLYANLVYQWERFYIPFGFNFSFPNFDDESIPTSTYFKIRGGAGAQFGLGYAFSDVLHAEILFHSMGLSAVESTNTGTLYEIDYSNGSLSDTRFIIKFAF